MNNKRKMKRIARVMALVLTGAMVLGGAATVKPVTAYAATIIDGQTTEGSLTITKHGATQDTKLEGAEFSVYKVMDLAGTEGNFTYTPVAAFENDLKTVKADELGNYSAADIEKLASALRDTALNAANPVRATEVQTTGADGVATFSKMPLGYYLVVETKAPDTYVAGSPFLVAIPSTDNYNDDNAEGTEWVYNVQVEAKNAQVNIDKKLADGDGSNDNVQDGSVKVGDYVKYVVTTKTPNFPADYTNAVFTITDMLSDGLEIQNDVDHPITVTVTGVTTTENTDYTVTANPVISTTEADLTVAFASNFLLKEEHMNKEVVVTYYAKVTEDAVTGTAGNPNEVKLTYTNKPNSTADSEPKTVYVYSFNIQVEKFTGTDTALKGAEFGLYSDKKCTKEVRTSVETNENGVLSFGKLDEGTYYLKELKAPAGYTLLTNPIEVVITATKDANGKANGHFTVTVDGKTVTEGSAKFTTRLNETNGTAYVAVENHKGFTLPSTGGAGIALFLIVGAAGIVLVSVAFTRKSRKAN